MYALLSALSGASLTLAFAPFNLHYIAFISLTILSFIWLKASKKRAALYGFLFGLGNFSTGLYWVYISLYYYGSAPLIFAIIANILLILYLSLFPCLAGYLLGKFSEENTYQRALLIPTLWMLLEFARAYILTGFPWLAIGYSQLEGILNALAPILGMWGVGLMLISIASLFALSITRKSAYPCICAFFIIAIALGARLLDFTRPFGETFSVALVQGNHEQDLKFSPMHMLQNLEEYIDLSEIRNESLIIWPESAIPFFEHQVREEILDPLDVLFKSREQTLITGILRKEGDNYYNSVIALGNGRKYYNKEHLLPFGEYLPLRSIFAIFEKYVDIPHSDFSRGAKNQAPLITNNIPAGVSICFEGAFGRVVRRSVPEARYLINLSNDAWFKDSIAAAQHLQMNQMRALELGREMARATNTGITAFIDHQGKIKQKLPIFETAVLSGWITPRIGMTPYGQFGNTAFITLLALYAIIAIFIYPKRNTYASPISS